MMHEDIEAVMQITAADYAERYEKIYAMVMEQLPYDGEYGDFPAMLELHVNHIIASVFEAILLKDLGLISEHNMLKRIGPKYGVIYNWPAPLKLYQCL